MKKKGCKQFYQRKQYDKIKINSYSGELYKNYTMYKFVIAVYAFII